jgi:hypothetical protein
MDAFHVSGSTGLEYSQKAMEMLLSNPYFKMEVAARDA